MASGPSAITSGSSRRSRLQSSAQKSGRACSAAVLTVGLGMLTLFAVLLFADFIGPNR
jgi:hypothetical protein